MYYSFLETQLIINYNFENDQLIKWLLKLIDALNVIAINLFNSINCDSYFYAKNESF